MIIGILFNAFNVIGSEWVMWLLIGLSVYSCAIIFERTRNLSKQEKVGALLWKEQVAPWMQKGEFTTNPTQAKDLSKKYPCVESGLLEVLSVARQTNKEDLILLMTSYLGRKKLELEKNVGFLGTLGSNAPFIGLFGTVLGIIKAFHDIGAGAEGGEGGAAGGAQSVSVGLSEALVATAIGLLVAIPAIMYFNHFQKKTKILIARAESLGNFVISNVKIS